MEITNIMTVISVSNFYFLLIQFCYITRCLTKLGCYLKKLEEISKSHKI